MYEFDARRLEHSAATAARTEADASNAEPIEVPLPQRAFRAPKCFRCGSHDVRRSHLQGRMERLAVALLTIIPYRCRDCGSRFWKIETIPFSVLKAALVISIIALALFMAGAFAAG